MDVPVGGPVLLARISRLHTVCTDRTVQRNDVNGQLQQLLLCVVCYVLRVVYLYRHVGSESSSCRAVI